VVAGYECPKYGAFRFFVVVGRPGIGRVVWWIDEVEQLPDAEAAVLRESRVEDANAAGVSHVRV
jgi:hypothetical protein